MNSFGKIIVLFLSLLLFNALHSYAESYGEYQGAIYLQNYDGVNDRKIFFAIINFNNQEDLLWELSN